MFRHFAKSVASFGLALAAAVPLGAQANVVFTSLPPVSTAALAVGDSVGTDANPYHPFLASQFTAVGSGFLTDIVLALYPATAGGPSLATVTLHADTGGSIGALLATGTGLPPARLIGVGATQPLLDVSMSSAIIAAGMKYWVEVTAGSPDDSWLVSATPGKSVGGSNTLADYQFAVNASSPSTVAEPEMAALIALGFAGMLASRGRRRWN